MNDINTISIIGRLTRDAELKYTTTGAVVVNFGIAVSRTKKDKQEDTSFFECTAFGKMAETLKPYLVKGKQVGVDGYLKQERWQDKTTGQSRSRIIIGCENIQLLGGNKNQQQAENDFIPNEYDFDMQSQYDTNISF